MKMVIGLAIGLLVGIGVAMVAALGSSVDDVFVGVDDYYLDWEPSTEEGTYQERARAWSRRCEELESSVARIEANMKQVYQVPAVWADIVSAKIARDKKWDSAIVRERIVRRLEERLSEMENDIDLKYGMTPEERLNDLGPYPDNWSGKRKTEWYHRGFTRLATWLDEEGVSDNLLAALDERGTDGWRTLHMIFPDLPSKINIEDIGRIMRSRRAALELELSSAQAELEHARHAQRVMRAKADGASLAIIEALEAEMYGVHLGGGDG